VGEMVFDPVIPRPAHSAARTLDKPTHAEFGRAVGKRADPAATVAACEAMLMIAAASGCQHPVTHRLDT